MDHPDDQAGHGEQHVGQDDRAGQNRLATVPCSFNVVLDEPDGHQVEPGERGDEPADQGGNAHWSLCPPAHANSQLKGQPGRGARRLAGPIRPPMLWVWAMNNFAGAGESVTDAGNRLQFCRQALALIGGQIRGAWS